MRSPHQFLVSAVLSLVLSTIAVAQSTSITKYDRFDDETRIALNPITAIINEPGSLKISLILTFKGQQTTSLKTAYLFFSSLSARRRFEAPPDLTLLVNGERLPFGTASIIKTDRQGSKYLEEIAIEITNDTLLELNTATTLEGRIGLTEFRLNRADLQAINKITEPISTEIRKERQIEIERLKQENEKLEKGLKNREQDLALLQALQAAAAHADKLREELSNVQVQQVEIQSRLESIDYALQPDNIGRLPKNIRKQRQEELESESSNLHQQLDSLKNKRKQLEDDISSADAEVDRLRTAVTNTKP